MGGFSIRGDAWSRLDCRFVASGTPRLTRGCATLRARFVDRFVDRIE
jgi:hypothetical protein